MASPHPSPFWGQKTFCLVTGASRGIGRAIAVEFARHVGDGSAFILVARSKLALEETMDMVKAAYKERDKGKAQPSPPVSVAITQMDMEMPHKDLFYTTIQTAFGSLGRRAEEFDHMVIVHNAGSLGNTYRKVEEMDDVRELKSYFDTNVISMVVLNTLLFKMFPDTRKQKSVIQITSLGALEPFKSWGYYCAAKAARDMIMKNLAAESNVQVLSWAPGPVQTDMYDAACRETGDQELKAQFIENKTQGKVLSPEQTASKLARVLATKQFVNGQHVDYFDVE